MEHGGAYPGGAHRSGGSCLIVAFIGIGIMVMVGLSGVAWLFLAGGATGQSEPQLWQRALNIELGDAKLRVLQGIGMSTCQTQEGEQEVWVFAGEEDERPGCVPMRGDLVVYFDEQGLVSAYEPEYGKRSRVQSDVDQLRFRRSAGATERSAEDSHEIDIRIRR